MKKIFFLFFIIAYLNCFAFGEENKLRVSIFGGIDNVFEYGSEDDYVAGGNDFPVMPAHAAPSFGLSFGYLLKNNIEIELNGKYILGSKVTLQDPSDLDTVAFKTSRHYSITMNILYHLSTGKFRPYLAVGGGVDKVLAKDKTYISEHGYEVEVSAPETKIDPLAQAGGGMYVYVKPKVNLRLDIRYVFIFAKPNNVTSIAVMAGIFFDF